jgi:SOS-response transcriptional repressor LexA
LCPLRISEASLVTRNKLSLTDTQKVYSWLIGNAIPPLTIEQLFEYTYSMQNEQAEKVRKFYRRYRRMPSITELMGIFKLASRSSAFYIANKLIQAGMLQKDKTGKLVPGSEFHAVPLVGHIRAGFAAPAEEELADTISIGEYLLRRPEASYLLTVEGDSMQDAGIHHGDMVVFERTQDYKPGDIVVALTQDGYTLKYLRKRQGRHYLEAANEDYPDIYPQDGEIIGVVTATFRKYG